MIEQYESDRFCRKCETWKPATEFTLRKDRKCGRESRCTLCRRADWRESQARKPKGDRTPARRINDWIYPTHNPRFGVAMIGGGL